MKVGDQVTLDPPEESVPAFPIRRVMRGDGRERSCYDDGFSSWNFSMR
jgi:hypothetical protein